jgi:hypothetical protein
MLLRSDKYLSKVTLEWEFCLFVSTTNSRACSAAPESHKYLGHCLGLGSTRLDGGMVFKFEEEIIL